MVLEYNIREEISPPYSRYWHQHYQQNLPDRLWYILIYIAVLMRYMCIWCYLSTYRYIYRMRIFIKSDHDWYKDIYYMHDKMIYSHLYSSIYDICVQMLLSKHVLVHIRDERYDLMLLSYMLNIYAI